MLRLIDIEQLYINNIQNLRRLCVQKIVFTQTLVSSLFPSCFIIVSSSCPRCFIALACQKGNNVETSVVSSYVSTPLSDPRHSELHEWRRGHKRLHFLHILQNRRFGNHRDRRNVQNCSRFDFLDQINCIGSSKCSSFYNALGEHNKKQETVLH